jgi:sugar (pentulose or hexulose) kinase
MRCLGLDLGSTSIKGAVLDLSRANLSQFHSEPFPGPESTNIPLGHEVCLDKVMAATHSVLARLIDAAPDADELYICSQMGGLVLSDSNGKPLSRYMSWRDQRTLSNFSTDISFLAKAEIQVGPKGLSSLGNELKAGSASALLFWLAQKELLPTGVVASSLGEWVVAQLCQTPISMHPTMAIGWLNLPRKDWDYESFENLGLNQIAFPKLIWDIAPVGTFQLGHRKLRVYPALGDQQCALYGTNLKAGELSINASTGSQVSRLNSAFCPGPYQSRFYFENLMLDTITHIPAGRSLNTIVDLLTEIPRANGICLDAWGYIANELKRTPNTQGFRPSGLDSGLSFFPGPLGETGYLSGITLENLSVRNWVIAALDSMAGGYRICADRLGPISDWEGLVLSGGLAHSLPTLRERIGEAFGNVPIRETPGIEETLMGLLRISQNQSGVYPKPEKPNPHGVIK